MHSWQNGTRCRGGVNVLWCRSHLVRVVFERSIPTCAGFHSENFFVTCSHFHTPTALLIYLQKGSSFALPSCACSTCNFASSSPNFHLIRAVRFLSGL